MRKKLLIVDMDKQSFRGAFCSKLLGKFVVLPVKIYSKTNFEDEKKFKRCNKK